MFTLLYVLARLRRPVRLLECPDRASLLRPGGLQCASGYRTAGAGTGYRRLSGGRQIAPSGGWASGNPTFTLSCGSPGTPSRTARHDCRFSAMLLSLIILSDSGQASDPEIISSHLCPFDGRSSSAPQCAPSVFSMGVLAAHSSRF